MTFDANKYKYACYTNAEGKSVISARSTYAGKTVKGYAKCNPADTYDIEAGKELAAARCNARVAQKRRKNAAKSVAYARQQLAQAQAFLNKMLNYQADADHMAQVAEQEVTDILNKIG